MKCASPLWFTAPVLIAIIASGCQRTSPPTLVPTAGGRGVQYRTITVPYGHGMKERGEVWLDGDSNQFHDVMGCPPYFCAVANSSYIILCRELSVSSFESIIVDTSNGQSFSAPSGSYLFGCWNANANYANGLINVSLKDGSGTFLTSFSVDTTKKTLGPGTQPGK